MNRVIFFVLIFLSSVASAENLFVGVWQSNEELSVAYLKNVPNISEKKLNFLSNGFFGKEKIKFTEKTITRESEIDEKIYHLTFNYQAIPLENSSYELVYSENEIDIETSQIIYFESGCYYVNFDSSGVREYFCRVK